MRFFPKPTDPFSRDEVNAAISRFRESKLKLVESFVREFLQNALENFFQDLQSLVQLN